MFRRPLRRKDVMRRLRAALAPKVYRFMEPFDMSLLRPEARARRQLAEDERRSERTRVEDPRQCSLPL